MRIADYEHAVWFVPTPSLTALSMRRRVCLSGRDPWFVFGLAVGPRKYFRPPKVVRCMHCEQDINMEDPSTQESFQLFDATLLNHGLSGVVPPPPPG